VAVILTVLTVILVIAGFVAMIAAFLHSDDPFSDDK
jgi:hypothetical protein